MRLKDMSSVLWSPVGCVQNTIIYDITNNVEMEHSCSLKYAVKYYGDWRVNRISAYEDYLVIRVEQERVGEHK